MRASSGQLKRFKLEPRFDHKRIEVLTRLRGRGSHFWSSARVVPAQRAPLEDATRLSVGSVRARPEAPWPYRCLRGTGSTPSLKLAGVCRFNSSRLARTRRWI